MPVLGIPPYIHMNIGLIGVQLGNQLDSSDGTGNAAIVYSTRASFAPGIPATNAPSLIAASYDAFGIERRLDFGGGVYGTPDQNRVSFWTAPTYTETPDTGLQRLAIEANGRVHVGDVLTASGLFQVSAANGVNGVGLYVDTPGLAATHRIAQALTLGSTSAPTASAMLDIVGAGGLRIARDAATGVPIDFRYVQAAHTGMTAGAGTEVIAIDWQPNATALQYSGSATKALQRYFRIGQPGYRFAAATGTLTDTATLTVDGAPFAGTNCAITRGYGIYARIAAVAPTGTVATAATIGIEGAPTGATTNHALWVRAGNSQLDGRLTVGDGLAITNVISPTALGAGPTANYNPTGLSTCTIIRQDTSAAAVVSGLVAQEAGREIRIINISANTLTLNNEDAASTAANRFLLTGGANYVIAANGGSIILWYDTTSARWRNLGNA